MTHFELSMRYWLLTMWRL